MAFNGCDEAGDMLSFDELMPIDCQAAVFAMCDKLLIQNLMTQMSWIARVGQINVQACQSSIKEIASLVPHVAKVGSSLKPRLSRRI